MTLPASGQISMSQVSVELGRASTYATSLGETAVRNLAGVASGAISFSNLHGKSAWTLGFNATYVSQGDTNFALFSDGSAGGGNLTYWGTPATAGIGNSYWMKIDGFSGTPTPGSIANNTWYQLNATRSWGLWDEGASGTGTIYIAAYSGGPTLASCTWYIANT